MDQHGLPGAAGVPAAEKFHQQGMVLEGDLAEVSLGAPVLDSLHHRMVDDGDQAGEKAVVGGGDDGHMKGLLGLGPVLPIPDDLGNALP